MGVVDQYRPDSIPMPRTAAQVYQGDRPSSIPPKAQKGVEILEKIAGKLLCSYLMKLMERSLFND